MPIKVTLVDVEGRVSTQEKPPVGYVQWEQDAFISQPGYWNPVTGGNNRPSYIRKITLNPEGDSGPQIELRGFIRHDKTKFSEFEEYLKSKGIKTVKNNQDDFYIAIPWDIFKEVVRYVPDPDFKENLKVGKWLSMKENPLRLSELFTQKLKTANNSEDFEAILQLAQRIKEQQSRLKEQHDYSGLGKEFNAVEANAIYILATTVFKLKGPNEFFHKVYMEALMSDSRFFGQRKFLNGFNKDYNNPNFLVMLRDEVSKIDTANDLQREVRLMVLSMDPKANAQKKYLEELFGINKPTDSKQGGAQPEHKDAQANVARKEAKGIQLKASDPRIKQAMENARELSQQNKDAWWVLGEFLKENHLYYEAVQAFVNIPKDHPEYSNAQLECAHIYSQQWELIAAKDPKFQGLEEKENNKIKILEDGLRFAARANEPDIASMIYFQLIRKEFEPGKQAMMFERFAVPINAANVDAVIEGARIARETQNAMQAQYEAQIARQKKQIQDLQGQLARVENKAAVGAIAERGGIGGTQPLPSTAGQQGLAQPVPSAEPPKPKQ